MAERDNTGIKFPPPVIYVLGLLAGWWLERKYPLVHLPVYVRAGVGVALVGQGFIVARAGARAVWKANSSIIPIKPTTAIVTDGPYAGSRNPMYLGMVLIYIGVALLMQSAWALILLPPVILGMNWLVIAKEERYLAGKFGEPYLAYKSKVRRWI